MIQERDAGKCGGCARGGESFEEFSAIVEQARFLDTRRAISLC